jgi:hypothetical protein
MNRNLLFRAMIHLAASSMKESTLTSIELLSSKRVPAILSQRLASPVFRDGMKRGNVTLLRVGSLEYREDSAAFVSVAIGFQAQTTP